MKYIVIEIVLLISCFFYVKMLMFVVKKLFAEAVNENRDNFSEEETISVQKATAILTIIAWGVSNLFLLPIALCLL